jgi:HAE1 family hydrophobic/amphiphilic exporter-1
MNNRRRASCVLPGSRRARSICLALIFCAWIGSDAFPTPAIVSTAAQEGQPSPAGSGASLPPRVGITEESTLTLTEAIAQALRSNPEVAMMRIDVEQATDDIAAADGAFDPLFSVQSSFQRQQTPVSSLIGGSASGKLTQQGLLFGPDVSGVLRNTGTRYQVGFVSRRQTTDNQFVTLNPQFPSELSFSVTQPLFRGLRVDDARRQIDRARHNAALSDIQLRQQVMDLTLQTELAYWELFFAEENLQVQLQGLELARDQVASNQRLMAQGLAAPIDVLEAETQVATASQQVFTAQAALTRSENGLKTLMVPDRRSPLWTSALHPATPPADAPSIASLEDALQEARANRPELMQAAIAADTQESETKYLNDQRKPQIDFVATYVSSGLAGSAIASGTNPLSFGTQPLIDRINALSTLQGLTPLPALSMGGNSVPPALTGGFGRSLSNLAGLDFPTVEVGLRMSLPFRNRTAEARHASAVAESRRIRLRTEQLEIALEAEVRNAMQAVASARAGRDAARQARTLAEQQYASEQRRFEAGTSTVFLVLQRQTAMIATRTQYARAEADVSRAIAQLHHATGQSLSANQITLNQR